MKYILITLAILILSIPLNAEAITGPASRFDFSLGQPAVTADATTNCNSQATARFDFVLGQPAVVYDATATCTAAAEDGGGSATIILNSGTASLSSGTFIIIP